eukprot:193703-Hanusia_phi.AAC.1
MLQQLRAYCCSTLTEDEPSADPPSKELSLDDEPIAKKLSNAVAASKTGKVSKANASKVRSSNASKANGSRVRASTSGLTVQEISGKPVLKSSLVRDVQYINSSGNWYIVRRDALQCNEFRQGQGISSSLRHFCVDDGCD